MKLAAGNPDRSDGGQVLFHLFHRALALPFTEFLLQLLQRKVHDVVMMNLLRSKLVAEIQPEAVQKVDFLCREVRCMPASSPMSAVKRGPYPV